MLLAGGGVALIILLLLLRLAQSKRARRTEEPVFEKEAGFGLDDAADDGIEITFTETESTPTQETGGNIPLALSEESEEELSKTQTFNLESDTPSNHIDLDFDNLETAQNGILSSALTQDEETQKREHADWNDIESTDSVYEPEPVNPYNPVEIIIDTPQPQPAEQESVQAEIDTDFYNNLFPSNTLVSEKTEAEEPASDIHALSGLSGFLKASSSETVLEEPVAEAPTQEELNDFLKTDETKEAIGENVEEAANFNTAADDLAALLQPFATPAVEDAAPENISEVFKSNTTAENDLHDFLKDSETETVDWNISLPEENIQNGAYKTAITSESVGSDAPLEAKYDLAKMYLEIDDRDAAAETVKELLEEAEGDILKRAQALAQELGIM